MLRATTARVVGGQLQQVRSYAAKAQGAPKKTMKAPVSVRGKAGRFAMHFFEDAFAREGDAGVVRLEKELGVLDWAVRDQTSWRVTTTSPFFDLKWKREQVTKRLTAQGLSPLLIDLVMELVAQGEIRRLQQVRTDYDEIMRAYRREVDVTLTTSKPLSPERLALLKKSIQVDYLKPDDNLIFAHSIDDSLGGGYKVYIKGQEYDHSWANAIRTAEEENNRIVNAPRDRLSALPRPASISADELIKGALADKETQGWLPENLFARSVQLVKSRAPKGPADKAKVLQALRTRKSATS
jgi:F0F1-type ATP synthase delta subunit